MCFFSTICVLPEFANTFSMVCFKNWWLFGEWYHFSLFLPAFCVFVLLLWCKFHRMARFKSISHSHRVTWNAATEAKSPSPQGTRWIPPFWSLGFRWEKSWESVFDMAVMFLDTEVTNGIIEVVKEKGICSTCSFIALFIYDKMCEAPGVLSLEYYHQLFHTRPSFWMNNPCHLQILQITRSCRFMSLALVAFKGQACSETYEYRNTFSRCRHLSTSIYNRLKAYQVNHFHSLIS